MKAPHDVTRPLLGCLRRQNVRPDQVPTDPEVRHKTDGKSEKVTTGHKTTSPREVLSVYEQVRFLNYQRKTLEKVSCRESYSRVLFVDYRLKIRESSLYKPSVLRRTQGSQ